jgi:hypothetical protein
MFAAYPQLSLAEPTSPPTTIVSLRPYVGTSTVFVQVADRLSLCNTEVYTLDTSKPNGKNAYAAALSALVANKRVQLELTNAANPCTTPWGANWGAELQSIFVLSN